jgi:hypothetical protein
MWSLVAVVQAMFHEAVSTGSTVIREKTLDMIPVKKNNGSVTRHKTS